MSGRDKGATAQGDNASARFIARAGSVKTGPFVDGNGVSIPQLRSCLYSRSLHYFAAIRMRKSTLQINEKEAER
jgi:hypothetical protein